MPKLGLGYQFFKGEIHMAEATENTGEDFEGSEEAEGWSTRQKAGAGAGALAAIFVFSRTKWGKKLVDIVFGPPIDEEEDQDQDQDKEEESDKESTSKKKEKKEKKTASVADTAAFKKLEKKIAENSEGMASSEELESLADTIRESIQELQEEHTAAIKGIQKDQAESTKAINGIQKDQAESTKAISGQLANLLKKK